MHPGDVAGHAKGPPLLELSADAHVTYRRRMSPAQVLRCSSLGALRAWLLGGGSSAIAGCEGEGSDPPEGGGGGAGASIGGNGEAGAVGGATNERPSTTGSWSQVVGQGERGQDNVEECADEAMFVATRSGAGHAFVQAPRGG